MRTSRLRLAALCATLFAPISLSSLAQTIDAAAIEGPGARHGTRRVPREAAGSLKSKSLKL